MRVESDLRKIEERAKAPVTKAWVERRVVSGGAVDWSQVQGKPSVFPPDLTSHIGGDPHPQYMTQGEVDARVAQVVGAAPAALDTLNEIAIALGNDASFAATVTNALAGKSAVGHTHAQGDVAGLAAALAGKADVSHNQLAATITDLTAAVTAIVAGLGLGGDPWVYRSLALNHATSVTALAAVTGMSFTGVALTTYEIEVFGAFQAAATTTGIALALDIPSGSVIGLAFAPSSNTAVLATQTRADGAALAPTTGVATAAVNTPLWGKYLVTLGVTGGTVQLMLGSEVAASAVTLMAGLRMKYRPL